VSGGRKHPKGGELGKSAKRTIRNQILFRVSGRVHSKVSGKRKEKSFLREQLWVGNFRRRGGTTGERVEGKAGQEKKKAATPEGSSSTRKGKGKGGKNIGPVEKREERGSTVGKGRTMQSEIREIA